MVRAYTGIWCTGRYWSILPPTPPFPPALVVSRQVVCLEKKKKKVERVIAYVLIQPFLLSYANEVVFMLTRLVQAEFPKETMEV